MVVDVDSLLVAMVHNEPDDICPEFNAVVSCLVYVSIQLFNSVQMSHARLCPEAG